jgi:hypothetical protein
MNVASKKGLPYETAYPYNPFGATYPNICSATNVVNATNEK